MKHSFAALHRNILVAEAHGLNVVGIEVGKNASKDLLAECEGIAADSKEVLYPTRLLDLPVTLTHQADALHLIVDFPE
jgi:hypothetical protein